MKKLLDKILEKIRPQAEEREQLEKTAAELIERAERASSKLGVSVKPRLVGSAARGTWLRGERDIDIFLLLPENLSRKALEEKGLAIAREITEGEGLEQYAEHPYITVEIEGFDVDVVPCYDIKDSRKIRSSVDRSPHHQDYIKSQLTPELTDQILILKKFLKGIGVYGSELKIHGFSGYLCELLTIHYGSFNGVIQDAAEWEPGPIIDPFDEIKSIENAQRLFPDQPMIFIDPVDPRRNVAASVSMKNLATFVRACQDFERKPSESFFFPKISSLTPGEIRKIIDDRASKLYAIIFRTPPELVPDIIYPQLRKTERFLIQELQDKGFRILRSDVWSGKKRSIILLELSVHGLPKVRIHRGPPLGVDSESFIRKHISSDQKLAGPFIVESGRLIFELKRKYSGAKEVLGKVLDLREGFGKHVAMSIETGYEIVEDEKIAELPDEDGLHEFLTNYLNCCLPWVR